MKNDANKTDQECNALLKRIFNDLQSLLDSLAPMSWANSTYIFLLHPSAEQQYEESIKLRANINRLTKKKGVESAISKDDFKQDDLSKIQGIEELTYLIGLCTYDIFSNNHQVIASDGGVFDLGSMRGSGSFIADFMNDTLARSEQYDYIDFYMGPIFIRDRADLTPLYEHVFKKLQEAECDWEYSFPRLFAIDLSKMISMQPNQKMEEYKPEEAAKKELEMSEKDKQAKKMQEEFDNAYEGEYEEAKYKPLDQVVQAYKKIYGVLPNGHPQKSFE